MQLALGQAVYRRGAKWLARGGAARRDSVRKIANQADTCHIPIAPHNPGGPICMAAALHLAAAIPSFHILEQMEDERPLRDALCTIPLSYYDGFFELPTAPGLGTDLKLEVLRERPFRPQPIIGSS